MSTPSGAYVERGPKELQLYASIPGSDALVAVLEVDGECPGRVYTYFMRYGFVEGMMSGDELRQGATALVELVTIAQKLWPQQMKARVAA